MLVFVLVLAVLWRTFADIDGQSSRAKWRIFNKPATKSRIFIGEKTDCERGALPAELLAHEQPKNFNRGARRCQCQAFTDEFRAVRSERQFAPPHLWQRLGSCLANKPAYEMRRSALAEQPVKSVLRPELLALLPQWQKYAPPC